VECCDGCKDLRTEARNLERILERHIGESEVRWQKADIALAARLIHEGKCSKDRGLLWRAIDAQKIKLGGLILLASAAGNLLVSWLIWYLQRQQGG